VSDTRFLRSLGFGVALCTVFAVSVRAQELTDEDVSEIQALSAGYLRALGACDAEAYADLFVPDTGYFASGFRGHFEGREQIIKLVQSERQCTSGNPPAPRPGGNAPNVLLDIGEDGVFGVVALGTAEYRDEYRKTAAGWRFASRTVLINSEIEAGLGADDLLAINELAGRPYGEYYEDDANGVPRLLSVGTRITVVDGEVTGRVFLPDGSSRDEVYEKTPGGQWRMK